MNKLPPCCRCNCQPCVCLDGITIYHANCRELLPLFADDSFDLVLTDPPYGLGVADWDDKVPCDLLPSFLSSSRGAVVWFGAAPTLAEDSRSFSPPPQRILIWHVSMSLAGTAANGIYYNWHPIYGWNLPERHDGPVRDVLTCPAAGRSWWNHPATKPLKLIHRLCGFAPRGGLILDPFAGSAPSASN